MSDAPTTPAPAWRWPATIVGLLALQVLMCVVALYFALGDRHFAVEPDYYRQALRWDDQQAAARLGWTVALTAGAPTGAFKERALAATVAAADGTPLAGATVGGLAFPHAAPAERQVLGLAATAPGAYAGGCRTPRAGLWEFRLTITRGADKLSVVRLLELPAAAAGRTP